MSSVEVPAHPNIWTDGSRDEDLDALIGIAGAGAFVRSATWVAGSFRLYLDGHKRCSVRRIGGYPGPPSNSCLFT